MRIAFVVHGYVPSIGGAQSYTRGLAEAIGALGHDTHVVAPAVDDPEAFYELGHRRLAPGLETIGGVSIHRVPLLSTWRRFPRRLEPTLLRERRQYATRLAGVLSQIAPDAVVALPHLFPNVTAAAGLHPRAGWRLAHAPMLHEHDPHWSVEAVAEVVRAADLAIALTDHERDRLVESYGARAVAVIPPGVESHSGCEGGGDRPIVLYVGRTTAAKGLDLLDTAMSIVQRDMPEAELVIAGPGADTLPPGHHTPVESPTDATRSHLVEAARVVVNPSIVESFGLTTLEAWAHRTPVVVADTPVNRSIVRDGVDGLVARVDATALAEGLKSLLGDAARAARLGDEGHRRAREEFSWVRSARRLVDALA